MKKGLLLSILLFAPIMLVACTKVQAPGPNEDMITSFKECVAAGNPVMESYPRQCRHGEQIFREIISQPEANESDELSDPNEASDVYEIEICESFKGTWLPEFRECENIDKDTCDLIRGTYDECASACRNDPTAEICTMQCVQVCKLPPKK